MHHGQPAGGSRASEAKTSKVPAKSPHPRSQLTPFEFYVLQLMAAGMRRSEIAHKLHRSPQTISNLLTLAKDKIGARTLSEATALVARRKQNVA